MTTTVIVHAHCTDDIKVKIQTNDPSNPQPDVFIDDGETHQAVVFDERTLTVSEVPKEK